MQQRRILEKSINTIDNLQSELDSNIELLELAELEGDSELVDEISASFNELKEQADKAEFQALLSHDADVNDCYLSVYAGSGGTEAQDWAEMLLRMYQRFATRHGFQISMIDENVGDEAGIKSTTLRISGDYAFGWLKTEAGIHRLVRISPFDSSGRRHTSFAAISVYPHIDDDFDIDIKEEDVRVDTYRASGAGGQHVNTTDSAVRLTHIPTGVVVQCQSDRSQHKNRATAWSMLRSQLYDLEMKKREEEAQDIHQKKSDNSWGSQIRSYVLYPYKMVKDLRTSHETSDTTAVLDGKIDEFIEKSLAQNAKKDK